MLKLAYIWRFSDSITVESGYIGEIAKEQVLNKVLYTKRNYEIIQKVSCCENWSFSRSFS